MKKALIRIGYGVGTGEPVLIPLAHTFVTGQTQNSGKTTALQAIVVRSGRRAIAFVTKRGERGLEGRRIRPYLPREGDQPISWRLVETLIASALGQRAMPKERYGIMSAARGQTSLNGVQKRTRELMASSKGETARMYELLVEYLDLVLPEMDALRASPTLELGPGLNVMDLSDASEQLQAMVMRAALEQVYERERDVLTVFPEAWEFAPRDRMTPARPAAAAIARKGAGLGNFLLADSQDIAGVDPVIRQAASVWLVGVQREANERKRMLDIIRASVGVAPKPDEVATLGIGQFFVCVGRTAVKTYVQPTWMGDDEARGIAMGAEVRHLTPAPTFELIRSAPVVPPVSVPVDVVIEVEPPPALSPAALPGPVTPPNPEPESEDEMSAAAEKKLDTLVELMTQFVRSSAVALQAPSSSPPIQKNEARGGDPTSDDEEGLYRRFKDRLLRELPNLASGLTISVTPVAKLRADFMREEANRLIAAARALRDLPKRVLKLLETTDEHVSQPTITKRLGRSDGGGPRADLARAVSELAALGFVDVKPKVGTKKNLRAKIAVDMSFHQPTEEDIEAVYQTVLADIAQAGADR